MSRNTKTNTLTAEVEAPEEITELETEESTIETEAGDEETVVEPIVEQVVRHLVGKIEQKLVTPYAVHTVINGAFEVLGHEKRVRPQMMYNYDKNGIIAKGRKGVKSYTHDEVIEFATKFVEKHAK